MVDDHPAFRLGVTRLLERSPEFEVRWSAGSVAQAVRTFERSPVDVILMDLHFSEGADGLHGLKIMHGRWPEARILIVSAFADRHNAAAARAAGAAGIVGKDAPLPDLYAAIKQAATRAGSKSPKGRAKPAAAPAVRNEKLSKLTKRELEVLEEIRRGLTNREIALRLGISTTTVNKHVHRVLTKLGARNRAQAAIVR